MYVYIYIYFVMYADSVYTLLTRHTLKHPAMLLPGLKKGREGKRGYTNLSDAIGHAL